MLGNLNLFRTLNVGDTRDDRWDRTQRAWFVKPGAFLITSGEPKSLTRKRLTMPCRAKSAVNWARFALLFRWGQLGVGDDHGVEGVVVAHFPVPFTLCADRTLFYPCIRATRRNPLFLSLLIRAASTDEQALNTAEILECTDARIEIRRGSAGRRPRGLGGGSPSRARHRARGDPWGR